MTHVTIWIISTAHWLCSLHHYTHKRAFLVLIRGLCTTSQYTHSIPLCEVAGGLLVSESSCSCLRSMFHELEVIRSYLTFWLKFSFPRIHDWVVSFRLPFAFNYCMVICQIFDVQHLKSALWTSWFVVCTLFALKLKSLLRRPQTPVRSDLLSFSWLTTFWANAQQFYAFCLRISCLGKP